ncbi:MAG: MFS transporter, partial [Actinomycetota bacterium]
MAGGQGSTERTARFAAGPLVVLALVNLVDQIDTSVLRGVLPILKEDWALSDFQLGSLGFAFVFVHSLAAIPSGFIADRYRRTRAIGYTLLSWSAISALAAASVNYANLFVARALLGIGQAVDDPSSSSLLADYYPARQRGRVFAVQQVATFVGLGAGVGLGGFIASAMGWRWAFLLVGGPGSIIAFLVFKLREPHRGESDGITREQVVEHDRFRGGSLGLGAFLAKARHDLWQEMRMIFGIPTMRYILVGVATLLFTVTGIGYWLAVYHQRYSGMSVTESTSTTAVIFVVGGLLGTFAGGWITDRVYGRGPASRITAVGVAILVSLGLILASFSVPVAPRIALQILGVAVGASAAPGIRASMMDVVPAASRGVSASAFALTSAIFGQALAPPFIGLISDLTSSLLAAFYIVSPQVAVGALILLRARKTIGVDAQAILEAIVAR